MREICLVTTFNRDELLFLCLEAIRKEDPDLHIWVFSDREAGSPELWQACRKFGANCVIRDAHDFYGNSYNLLEACKWAASLPYLDLIHLIEEDTILHGGYLEWARTQLATGHYAAVCGRIGSPHIPNWYESPIASWRANTLRMALSHLVPEYYSPSREEMQRVLDEKMFPASAYRRGGAEQDGFFLRVIENHKWKTKFPATPLASHQGSWGYNQSREAPKGSFEERIAFCRALLNNREERRKIFGHRITDAEMEGWNGRYEAKEADTTT